MSGLFAGPYDPRIPFAAAMRSHGLIIGVVEAYRRVHRVPARGDPVGVLSGWYLLLRDDPDRDPLGPCSATGCFGNWRGGKPGGSIIWRSAGGSFTIPEARRQLAGERARLHACWAVIRRLRDAETGPGMTAQRLVAQDRDPAHGCTHDLDA